MQDPYDVVAYPGLPFANTHPDNLAAMAILHGMTPPTVESCRVLEIGCNEGANLIPMAYAIPGSEFVGFDLARMPVERAQARIRELGLTNIRIFEGDLLEAGEELGKFDYIIAHGIYAWVPERVREGLLALIGKLLSENGVAFISYNAMPGSHIRRMLREMMIFQTETLEGPAEKVESAIGFLRFIEQSRQRNDPFSVLISEQLRRMEKHPATVVFHDEFAGSYHPVHFSEFAEHASQHGLQYLSESTMPAATDPGYRAETCAAIEKMAPGNRIRQEQILDFLRVRVYRETLLCKKENTLRCDFPADHFRRLLVSSPGASIVDPATGQWSFALPSGARMESNHPGVIALLKELEAAWPCALPFANLEPRLPEAGLTMDNDGAAMMMRLAVANMIELHAWDAPVSRVISSRPKASAVSRHEAGSRAQATTLLHSAASLEDPFVRGFLRLLDGTRTKVELLEAMKIQFPEKPVDEIEQGIGPALEFLRRAGFLEA